MDSALVTMQKTACQFGDDNILTNAAKLGFAVSTLAIPVKHETEILLETALECQVPLIKLGEPCVYNHSESARNLCVHFYEILKDFAVMREWVNETVKRLGYNTGVN